MIYVTGDIHGNQILWDACINRVLNEGDTIIVLGDFGVGFFDGRYSGIYVQVKSWYKEHRCRGVPTDRLSSVDS